MLYLDYKEEVTVNNTSVTLYRDYQQQNKYYYLPHTKVRVADNGDSFLYIVLMEGNVVEVEEGAEDNKIVGFLNFSTELGPTAQELEAVRQELRSTKGLDQVILAAPDYIGGSAKVSVFAHSGGEDTNKDIIDVNIVGSDQPALQGTQRASFAAKIEGMAARGLYLSLTDQNNPPSAPIGVHYELVTYGLIPAYNVKITVDFRSVDDYWNHKINLNGNVQFGETANNAGSSNSNNNNNQRSKIATSVDIDILIQDLISEGAIKVEAIDYRAPGANASSQTTRTSIEDDAKKQADLVKALVGPSLFQTTILPPGAQNAIDQSSNTNAETPRDADGGDDDGGDGTGPGITDPVTTPTPPDDQHPGSGGRENPGGSNDSDGNDNPSDDTPTDTAEDTEGNTAPPQEGEDRPQPPTVQDDDGTPATTDDDDSEASEENSDAVSSSSDVQPKTVNINLGYTLKHRKITQQTKRVFEFSKIETKRILINPSSSPLVLKDTAFNPDTQVQIYDVNQGPFKEKTIEIKANFDFEEYAIMEAIVHINYGYTGAEGDKSKRLHHLSYALTPDKKNRKIKFFVDKYGTQTHDYYVEFIHESNSIIGTHETKIVSDVFEEDTEGIISVNLTEHSPLIPVDIQAGNLAFSDDAIRSVQIFVAPEKDASGRTIIFNEQDASTQKYLIFPSKFIDDDPTYYYKTEFFFQGQQLEFEFEDQKDSQIIVNSPDTRILTIAPNLVNSSNMIQRAVIDVEYRNSDNELRQTVINLNEQEFRKEFNVLVDEDDPRSWQGRSRFVLNNGQLLEGDWLLYDTTEPFVNLGKSGFRVIDVSPVLGPATFNGNIAAIEVALSDTEDKSITNSVFLTPSNFQAKVILRGVAESAPVDAVITIYRTDGSSETQNALVTAGRTELKLFIFAVN